MTKTELQTIVNDTAGLFTAEQKEKAQAALDSEIPQSGDGFTTLYGLQHIYPSEVRHFSMTVASGYADDLLKTRSMDAAAKQAANDCLLLGLQAKYDKDAENLFCKRFPKDAYRLMRVE
jgi:hypothetical protein